MRRDLETVTANVLAFIITFGFFTTVMISLLGFVDLHDATTSSFVGIALGYVAGSMNHVLGHYFKKDTLVIPPSKKDNTHEP